MNRLLLLLLFTISLAADDVVESRRFYQQALEARKANDTAGFLKNVRAASDLRPQHPTLLVQLAAALAANGQEREAVTILDRVATMGFVYELDEPELAKVRDLARLRTRFEKNARAIGTAKQELKVDRIGIIPEGMAYDAARRRFFVSSVRKSTIFAIDDAGRVTEFAKTPWGAFGMAIDAKNNTLWATTSAMPVVEGFREDDRRRSALLRIDLKSGEVVETIHLDGEHQFGDVAVAADGEVFVSDSASPVIRRVRDGKLESYVEGPFVSMQGIAASRSMLYVADYSKGLFAVDRRTRDVHPLRVPRSASLLGIDGLYFADPHTLIATQNGTNPYRVLRIRLEPGGLAVASVETLLANAPNLGDPTLGVIARGRFYFNANAQWELFAEDGTITDPVKLQEAVVLSVPLR